MTGQYRKIADYDTVCFHPDSPVLIEKMRLQHDLIYNVNVLQITFRNVNPLNIYGLGIAIVLRNEAGKIIHKEIEFNYYGVEVPTGKSFGVDQDIVVEPDAMRFEVSVVRADLEEGKRFHGRVQLLPMPEAKPLSSLGEFELPFLEKLAEVKPKLKAHCAPESEEGYWRCVCKRIYPYSITQCPVCRIKTTALLNIVPDLKEEKRAREAEIARLEREREEEERRRREAEERRRREEEERRRREEEERRRLAEERARQRKAKRKKQLKIFGVSLAGVAAVVCIFSFLPKLLRSNTSTSIPADTAETLAPIETVRPKPTPPQNPVLPEELAQPILLLSESLDETETKTLWRLFGTAVTAPEEYDTLIIGTDKQRIYMTGLLGEKNVEERALSSVLILPKEEGYGLHMNLFNITGCTEEMYLALLADIGISDAEVVIAAPEKASGSSALAGLYLLAGHMNDYVGKGIGTAIANGYINIRSADSVNATRYATITPGTELEVLEIMDNGWMKIVWQESLEGYAYTAFGNGEYYKFIPHS